MRVIRYVYLAVSLFAEAHGYGQSTPNTIKSELRGRLVDGDVSSYDGLVIELANLQNRSMRERAEVSSDGSFVFRDVPEGDYELRVTTLYDHEITMTVASVGPVTMPIEIRLPQTKLQRPVSGTVSLRQLSHPLSKEVRKLLESGQRLNEEQQFDQAAVRFRQAVREAPDCAQAHADLGLALSKMRQFDAAVDEYRAAIVLEPRNSLLHSNLGSMLAASNHFDEAEREAATALKLDSRNVRAHFVIAGALLHKHAPLADALPHLLAAQEVIPSAREAVAKICAIHYLEGCPN